MPKNNVTKIYCEKCDAVFESRKKFERHCDTHSSHTAAAANTATTTTGACESCPIDTIIAKFLNLFK